MNHDLQLFHCNSLLSRWTHLANIYWKWTRYVSDIRLDVGNVNTSKTKLTPSSVVRETVNSTTVWSPGPSGFSSKSPSFWAVLQFWVNWDSWSAVLSWRGVCGLGWKEHSGYGSRVGIHLRGGVWSLREQLGGCLQVRHEDRKEC